MSAASEPRCAEVRERLVAYLDEELPAEERQRLRGHLERCPPCEQRAGFERGFTSLLRQRLNVEAAPESLARRVRRALDEEAQREAPARAGVFGWRLALGMGGGYALAALFLVLWLAGPALRHAAPGMDAGQPARAEGGPGAPGPAVAGQAVDLLPVHVLLRGTIVCATCEKFGVPMERQQKCEAYGHFNGLRDEQGRLWFVAEEGGGEEVLHDGRLRGRLVQVDGEVLEGLNYLLPRTVQLL